jgi:hypothetical protein
LTPIKFIPSETDACIRHLQQQDHAPNGDRHSVGDDSDDDDGGRPRNSQYSPRYRLNPSGSGLPDFSCDTTNTGKNTKLPQNILNVQKIYQMALKYTNIFHSKTVQNGDFWSEN